MSHDPLVLMAEVDRAVERLLRTASTLDGAVGAPSLLPGWTRGHVLTHVARNADSMINLLTWARTGVVTPQYPSREIRNRDIDAGAPRDLAEQITDVRESAARFATAAADMPADAWAYLLGDPYHQPAACLVWRRLREVEIHHVDLAAGYGPGDWPEAFGQRLLRDVATGLATAADAPPMTLRPTDSGHPLVVGDPDAAPTISGASSSLAAWLIGRSAGADLTVSPPGELPTPPPWI